MIDQIWVQPAVHVWVGTAVLIATLLSLIVTATFAVRKRALDRTVYAVLLFAQVSLMAQVLVGIKLLDQGLGPLQLYIHYLRRAGRAFLLPAVLLVAQTRARRPLDRHRFEQRGLSLCGHGLWYRQYVRGTGSLKGSG